ncbi:MAG TPA: IS481 family transposase [Myxococcales bacterium]|nr:IS481 family transposase [Myxococcales bacterium]
MEFVIQHRSGTLTMAELCRLYGISRQTGHKWVNRFSPRRGESSLEELSRRPHHSPTATAQLLVDRIVARRKQFPTWGARKILELLQMQWPQVRWPAPSTVEEILKRHGLVRARKRRLHLIPRTQPFSHCVEPNDVWCVDFKGQFRTGDGTQVYPLTVMDAASRFLLACTALRAPESAPTRKVFEELFRKHGLPKAIRCDNGEPFIACRAPAGLSRLSAWWVKLGIRVERIDPGKPQQNGRHERMHLTLKIETALPPKSTFDAQARAFDRFRRIYNQIRPHEALAMRTPASLYRSSPRSLPRAIPRPQYPFADLCRVDTAGSIRWGNYKYFISSSLARETIGVYVLDQRYAEVRFAQLLLGVLDTEQPLAGLIRPKPPRKPRVSTMSPV